jgi:hypothetical protein
MREACRVYTASTAEIDLFELPSADSRAPIPAGKRGWQPTSASSGLLFCLKHSAAASAGDERATSDETETRPYFVHGLLIASGPLLERPGGEPVGFQTQ